MTRSGTTRRRLWRLLVPALLGGAVALLSWSRRSSPAPAVATRPPGPPAPLAPELAADLAADLVDECLTGAETVATAVGPERLIKGNAQSMIFHTPGSPSYARTVAQVWFATEEEALAAGFRAPRKRGAKGD